MRERKRNERKGDKKEGRERNERERETKIILTMSFHNVIIIMDFLCEDRIVCIDGISSTSYDIVIRNHRPEKNNKD